MHPQFAPMMRKLRKFQQVQFATNGDNLSFMNVSAILQGCTTFSLSLHEYKLPIQTSMPLLFRLCRQKRIQSQVSILETDLPKECKDKFVSAWQNCTERVRIYEEHSHNGFGSSDKATMDNGEPCHKPFEDMIVYWNGQVGLCNHDWNNLTELGNLNEQSVADVWNNQAYEDVRKKHKDGLRRTLPSCRSCEYYTGKMKGELYE